MTEADVITLVAVTVTLAGYAGGAAYYVARQCLAKAL